MKRARDFKDDAREALFGHWMPAVGTTFVAGLLGGGSVLYNNGSAGTLIQNQLDGDSESADAIDSLVEASLIGQFIDGMSGSNVFALLALLLALSSVVLIIAVVQYLIGSFVTLGLIQYNLNLHDGKEARLSQIFSKTDIMGRAMLLRIRVSVFTFLWSLLLIVPGIVKGYAYSMAPYILSENPEMSAKEAMEMSMRMMSGNKWRLFCLEWSFIGWSFLCILTLGIGFLWLTPYQNAAFTSFYDEVSRGDFY